MEKDFAIKKDSMTPRERMAAFFSGKKIDRLPFILHLGEYAARLIGVSVACYSHDPEKMALAQIAAFREYGPDAAGVGPGLFGIAEAMGARLRFPEEAMPFIEGPVIFAENDLERFVPANPQRDGRLPLYLEALQRINKEIGNWVSVSSSVGGPLTIAATLRGTENLLKDFYYRPEWVHRLLHLVTVSALNYIDAAAALGFKVGISEPTASGSLISPSHFREFALPYLKLYCQRIKEHCGSGPHLHICGDTSLIWDEMVATGASVLSLDNKVDLLAVKKAIGAKIAIAGNVPPVDTLLLGSPTQVQEGVKQCLQKAYDSPKGFIVCPGCALPLNTPPENVYAFAQAVRRYARCPIDPQALSSPDGDPRDFVLAE